MLNRKLILKVIVKILPSLFAIDEFLAGINALRSVNIELWRIEERAIQREDSTQRKRERYTSKHYKGRQRRFFVERLQFVVTRIIENIPHYDDWQTEKSDKFEFVLNAKSVEFTGQCKTTNNEKYCVNTRIAAENPCRTMPMPEAPVAHELSQILKDYGPNGRRDQ
eukprot:976250_1